MRIAFLNQFPELTSPIVKLDSRDFSIGADDMSRMYSFCDPFLEIRFMTFVTVLCKHLAQRNEIAFGKSGIRLRSRILRMRALETIDTTTYPAQSVPSPRAAGFTLIELLIVIAILGLLASFVGPALIRQLGSAKHRIAEQSIERLSGILDFYRLDIGTYPSTEQGLGALNANPAGVSGWNGPYLKDASGVIDPWGRPFSYRAPSTRAGHAFDIVSLGADGKSGGEGEDADILNR